MTTVYTHFSGSVCVVELTPGALRPGSNGIYIDVQRRGSLDRIELVRDGQVKQRFFECLKTAPGTNHHAHQGEPTMATLATHQRELLQAVLDGKELVGAVSGTPS